MTKGITNFWLSLFCCWYRGQCVLRRLDRLDNNHGDICAISPSLGNLFGPLSMAAKNIDAVRPFDF